MKRRELTDVLDSRADRREKALTLARVAEVHGKGVTDIEEGNIELTVETRALAGTGDSTRRHKIERIPYIAAEHVGHASVPHEGDHVWVDFTMAKHHQPVVVDVAHTDKHRAPNALEGHWRHQFRHKGDKEVGGEPGEDRLYLEAVPDHIDNEESIDPTLLRMGIKDDSLGEPTSEVAVDDRDTVDPVDWPRLHLGTDGEVVLVTDPEGASNHNVDVDTGEFDITLMTAKGRIRLYGEEEDIIVENEEGDIRVENEEGNVEIENTKGDITVQTEEGDIAVESEDGNIDARSKQGDIAVEADQGNVDLDAGGNVHVSTDGTFEVEAENITIHTDEGPKEVAYNDHTHDYSWTDSSGSGTTDQPNEDGTETLLG